MDVEPPEQNKDFLGGGVLKLGGGTWADCFGTLILVSAIKGFEEAGSVAYIFSTYECDFSTYVARLIFSLRMLFLTGHRDVLLGGG